MWIFKAIIFVTFLVVFVGGKDPSPKPSNKHEDIFKQVFKVRRLEQLEAVKKIRKLTEEKQQKMLSTIIKTIFDVISKSKVVLESSGFVPGTSKFPDSEPVRDALALVLENTALVGEIVLRLPQVAESVLSTAPEWSALLKWALGFAGQSGLVDNNTSTLMRLVSQELNITKRSPDYINPYRQTRDKSADRAKQDKEQEKKKKKKAELPRGPRLTLRQAGEL